MIKHISTGDGSSSLFVEELNETYHSRHGALRESEHVFIQKGLAHVQLIEISVLEVGMGTGLNVLLAAQYAVQNTIPIHLHTLEPFPIPQDAIGSINYPELLDNKNAKEWFEKIHSSAFGENIQLNPFFSFTKHKLKAEEYETDLKFDVVFYDAFGPHAQPELWELGVFEHLTKFLKKGSVLVTYCAQGQFKRNLKSAGFSIERLPGPPGKREMTRGTFDLRF